MTGPNTVPFWETQDHICPVLARNIFFSEWTARGFIQSSRGVTSDFCCSDLDTACCH